MSKKTIDNLKAIRARIEEESIFVKTNEDKQLNKELLKAIVKATS